MTTTHINQALPMVWVCPHCHKWAYHRRQLTDLSCFLHARDFPKEDIRFSADGKTILEIYVKSTSTADDAPTDV